jgi:uncharacterized membrane protein YdjX (TVP38/TMEM64 family)
MSTLKKVVRPGLKWILVTVFCAVMAGVVVYAFKNKLSREALAAYGEALPAAWFIFAYFTLPIVGFPVTIFLILAGVRFGFAGGMVVAALGMIFHHLVAFRLVNGCLRGRLTTQLERAGYRVPSLIQNHPISFTAIFAAVHGPPYIAKVYLLALTDISFRVYFWVGAPVYILFCVLPVGLGSSVVRVSPLWIYGVVFLSSVLPLGFRWLSRKRK